MPVPGAATGVSAGGVVSATGELDAGDGFPRLVAVPVAGELGAGVPAFVPGAGLPIEEVVPGVPGACVPAGVPGDWVEEPVVRGDWVEDPVVPGDWDEAPVVPGDWVESPEVPGAGFPGVVASSWLEGDASSPGASAPPTSGDGLEGVVWVVDATSCPGSPAGASVPMSEVAAGFSAGALVPPLGGSASGASPDDSSGVAVDTAMFSDGSPDNASSALCLPPHPATTRRSAASKTQHSTTPTRLDVDPVSARLSLRMVSFLSSHILSRPALHGWPLPCIS